MGIFKHNVLFSDDFAYASSFAINSDHEMMVADSRDGGMKLYRLTGKPPNENQPRYLASRPTIAPGNYNQSQRRSEDRSGFVGYNQRRPY